MTVTLTSLATGVTRTQNDQSARLSAALKGSASTDITNASSASIADSAATTDSVETSLASPALSVRLDSLNIAFVSTKLDVIDSGATQVSRILGQLQSLATQANAGGLSKGARELLNGQFQALRISINNVPPSPPGSEYTASSLLEGLNTGAVQPSTKGAASANDAVLGGFNDTKLLGDSNLLDSDATQQALTTIGTAQATISAQQSTIGSLQNQIDFAAASVEGAVQNQQAAQSTLTPEDLSGSAAVSLQASLQANADQARAAQTARLPNNVLQLLAQ